MQVKEKSNNEDDDDPWRNVSAADFAAVINRALVEDRDEAPPSGRVFVRTENLSRSALLRLRLVIRTQAVANTCWKKWVTSRKLAVHGHAPERWFVLLHR
jgi:hypothetical protein